MSKISQSPVLLKSVNFSISKDIRHVMLLLWLRMLWLGVNMTTIFPCLRVSELLFFVSCNVFRIVWQESLPTPQWTHTSHLLVAYWTLRVPLQVYKFLDSSHPKCFVPFHKPRQIIFIAHTNTKLMVCSLRSHTLPLQYISLLSILASALLMMF